MTGCGGCPTGDTSGQGARVARGFAPRGYLSPEVATGFSDGPFEELHSAREGPYDFGMRELLMVAVLGAGIGCSNDVSPRLIAGGGIGDGEIDGEVNVIDSRTDEPIAGADVAIGEATKTTDATGLVVFSDVEGAQTVAAAATGYRSSVWVDANGANMTIGLQPQTGAPEQATLQGTIAGWSNLSVAAGHVKAAFVLYSQTDQLGDDANNLSTPANGNLCFGLSECAWSVVTRTGSVTLTAIIIDRDTKNNADPADDTNAILGYAFKQNITVSGGVNQSGLVLDQIEAGNLETVTIDEGTPPAALSQVTSFPGIELGNGEVVQLPLVLLLQDATSYLVPKPTAFGVAATYRLTAIAQTSSGDQGAQSIVLRQGVTTPALAAGEWLTPPVNVMATRTIASWDPVPEADAHSAIWSDETGTQLLEITSYNPKTGDVEVPNLVALPATGMLTARINAIGADIDFNDFSLEEDSDKLWGVAAQPVDIP
jgi:hypothetical protein